MAQQGETGQGQGQGRARRGGAGFRRAGALVARPVRKAGESRGFAVARLLTHWEEIVGAETARIARPVEVSYARSGFGATLTLLTTGAHAPQLQMQEPRLRERINACYGYAAIQRIRVTQTAATGFAEGQVAFGAAPRDADRPAPAPEATRAAAGLAGEVADPRLRAALERLGAQVLSRQTPRG